MIKLAEEFGETLLGRASAAELRERIEDCAGVGDAIVIDFSGVRAVSPSFADEVFAKLPHELIESGQVRFENVSDDLLAIARLVSSLRPEDS